ncbi:MAG: YdeI/OmpD-associated family protein [Rhodobiaceae bacterium]|nr:YdeI/OmpD-associated family protein [Rhodobiaceae bacterium]
MSETDPRIEAFFAKATTWREALLALRAILLACPVSEEFKWRGPCYTAEGGNIATIWGFKDRCAIGFFKGVLLKDPENILVPPGDNSRSVRVANFTSLGEIAAMEATLTAYIREAIANEEAGLKVDLPKDDLDYPEELVGRIEDDPEFGAAFEALTPGRRRGYILNISQPKQAKTRLARIDKWTPKILEGKGMHDR